MLVLRSLLITKFRLVQPGTKLSFVSGVNILVGKNGTGKTTLLNLLSAAVGGNFLAFEDEDFDISYDLQVNDLGMLRVHARNARSAPSAHNIPGLSIPGPLGLLSKRSAEALPSDLQLDIAFEPVDNGLPPIFAQATRSTLTIQDSALQSKAAQPWSGEQLLQRGSSWLSAILLTALGEPGFAAYRKAPSPEHDVPGFQLLVALPVMQNPRFDESTVWIETVFQKADLRLMIGARLSEDKSRLIPLDHTLLPTDILLHTMQLRDPPDVFHASKENLDFLKEAAPMLGMSDILLQMDKTESGEANQPGQTKVDYARLRVYFTKPDGTRLPWERLSFGQQRLFGYLYYLSLGRPIALIDELANGLHHSMITDALAALGERQAFLATQNPLLLDELGFDSAEEVRNTFIRCESLAVGDRESWRWSQFSEQEAADFLRDYRIGIQHTNDILRTRGLW